MTKETYRKKSLFEFMVSDSRGIRVCHDGVAWPEVEKHILKQAQKAWTKWKFQASKQANKHISEAVSVCLSLGHLFVQDCDILFVFGNFGPFW